MDLTAEQRKETRPDIDRTDVVFADKKTYSFGFNSENQDTESKFIIDSIKAKFYLHETAIIETDSNNMTEPQLSVDSVNESTSKNNISQ